jgi:hypothetical protein
LPHIQIAYADAKHRIFDETINNLMLDTKKARAVLVAIMEDSEAPHGARVRAAQIVLEQSITIHKMNELEQEIAKLKEKVH